MLVPATVAFWLAGEITGFACMYEAGVSAGGFTLGQRVSTGLGTVFYFSAGSISTLTFGDLLPRTALYRAVVDVEAVVGLSTFTLALGYVVTAFGVLGHLDGLHGIVERHARHAGQPTSILARHYRGGEPTELTDLLQDLSERVASYDDGLRRYPVVFYFHTRRDARSIPAIFSALAEVLAALRWGCRQMIP
jgi:hypothetical protein